MSRRCFIDAIYEDNQEKRVEFLTTSQNSEDGVVTKNETEIERDRIVQRAALELSDGVLVMRTVLFFVIF